MPPLANTIVDLKIHRQRNAGPLERGEEIQVEIIYPKTLDPYASKAPWSQQDLAERLFGARVISYADARALGGPDRMFRSCRCSASRSP